MSRIRPHLTYSNVMSTIAVFGVLAGGSAWAASKIGTNQIKNGAVTTKKIKNDAVTGAKVNESSFGQVPDAARAGNATNASQLGGVPAAGYLRGYERVIGNPTPDDTQATKFAPISCPSGKKLVALGVEGIFYVGTLPAIIPQWNDDGSGDVISQKYDGQSYRFIPEGVCANG